MTLNNEQIVRLLKLVAEKGDSTFDISWDELLEFYVLCNDVFFWGCADLEFISSDEDIDLLEKCYDEIKEIETKKPEYVGRISVEMLYASRHRKMRPQTACYPRNSELWWLFDECGPEREVDMLNPIHREQLMKESTHEQGD